MQVIYEMYVAKVEMEVKSKHAGSKGILKSSKEIICPTYEYAHDVANVVIQLEQPKHFVFYREELVNIIQERLEKGMKKISEGISYDKYFQIYKEENQYGTLKISLKRESLK